MRLMDSKRKKSFKINNLAEFNLNFGKIEKLKKNSSREKSGLLYKKTVSVQKITNKSVYPLKTS